MKRGEIWKDKINGHEVIIININGEIVCYESNGLNDILVGKLQSRRCEFLKYYRKLY